MNWHVDGGGGRNQGAGIVGGVEERSLVKKGILELIILEKREHEYIE